MEPARQLQLEHLLGFLKPDKGGSQILGMDCRLKVLKS